MSLVCKILKISRSSYYYRKSHPKKDPYTDAEMQPVIDMFKEHHGAFGRRTLKALLEKKSINYSEWKISRIMKIKGLESKYKNKNCQNNYTSKNTKKYIKENIYPKLTESEKEKEIWTTDFTEEKINDKKIYTCAIKSINSKVIVGFKMSSRITHELALEALEEAISRFGSPYMILTDRGTQFVSKAFHDTIEKHGIIHSMSRPRRSVDNCFIETLWQTIKTEIGPIDHLTTEEYIMVMHYYWDYYNYRRPHSSINYESPIERYLYKNVT